MTLLVALLRHAGCVLLGVLVALGALAAHRSAPPWGLLLAVAASWAVPWRLLLSRWPRTAASYVVGWLAMLGLVVAGRPEGDYALAGDLAGYSLLAAGFVLVGVGVVALAGGRR